MICLPQISLLVFNWRSAIKTEPAIAVCLPQELLLEIFLIAAGAPTRVYSEHLDRQANLLSFALVHPSWTSVAQKVLKEEVWINGDDASLPMECDRAASHEIESYATRHLTVDGCFEAVMATVVPGRWIGVTRLRYLDSSTSVTVGFVDFAQLPSQSTRISTS